MLIGIDPFIGNKGIFFLHGEIIDSLKEIGFCTLNQIKRPRRVVRKGHYWLNSKDIRLPFIRLQNGIIILIKYLFVGIKLNDYEDIIMWVWDKQMVIFQQIFLMKLSLIRYPLQIIDGGIESYGTGRFHES